jgi:four helix bundle protein
MLSINQAPVFQATYDLIKEIHLARRTFHKSEKYGLGEKLEQSILEMLMDIIEAGRSKREWKITSVDSALHKLEKTKILLRLCWDLKQIPEGRICDLQKVLQKIGRMLGGWRRSL